MPPAALRELLPELRGFPRLKELTLEGQKEQGFAFPTAELRHLPALEKLAVLYFGTMALSEPLPRLTSLAAGNAHRLVVGAGAALPSLRSLETEAIDALVLRGSLPQLTSLGIYGDDTIPSAVRVSAPLRAGRPAGRCSFPARVLRRSAWASRAATLH